MPTNDDVDIRYRKILNKMYVCCIYRYIEYNLNTKCTAEILLFF